MKLRLHKSVTVVFFVFTLLGHLTILWESYLAVFIHEMAHLAVCICTGESIEEISFGVWGMCLKTKRVPNTKKALAVWTSGPLISFFLFWIFFLGKSQNFFMYANLCIGIVNLFPVLPLDGGMILKILLSSELGVLKAGKITRKMSLIICFAGIVVMAFCFMTGIFNLSLFIFVPMLIVGQKSASSLCLQDKRLVLSGEIKSCGKFKYVAVDSSSELLAIAELISPSHKLFVAVFDKGKFLGAMTQEKIIYAIMKKGALANLGECNFS